jgi:CBS domain-containing protein
MAIQSVEDLMTPDPACCTPDDPVTVAARLMIEHDCGAIPVVEDANSRKLVGIITDRDIVVRVVAEDNDPAEMPVELVMSTDLVKIGTGTGVEECAQLMAENRIRRLPVVDEAGRLVGIVAQADLARASAQQPELEEDLAEMLEEVSEPAAAGRM